MNKPILIKFGDNDFSNVFLPLLKTLSTLQRNFTKEQLVELINEISYSFYLLAYWPCPAGKKEDIIRYLKITNITNQKCDWGGLRSPALLYGYEEVDAFFKETKEIQNTDHDTFFWYPGQEEPQVI